MFPKQVDMKHDKADQESRQDSGVQRKKSGQGMMPGLIASNEDLFEVIPDNRRIPNDIGSHLRGPISFLVPRQEIAGEPQPHRHRKQGKAEPEIELTGGLVGSIHHHLDEMQDQQDNHELRGPVVDTPQPDATLHMLLEMMNTFPSRIRARTVEHPEHNPCDELDHDRKGQGASPDIAPPRTSRNILKECLLRKPPDSRSVVDPIQKRLHGLRREGVTPIIRPLFFLKCLP